MKFYSKNSDQEYFSEFWEPQKKTKTSQQTKVQDQTA